MPRTGVADMPLHWGKAPRWLFQRMVQLSRQIVLVLVEEYGPQEILVRLSDPHWFQAFGCVLGFDWHSSGLTTTVGGALKEGLRGLEGDTGLYIAGGKGRTSRRTPEEIVAFADKEGFLPEPLVYASRMAAKVDSSALQDGYQVYHHLFIFTIGAGPGACPYRRYRRRRKQVDQAVREMFLAGVSTRRVGEVLARLTGEPVSAQTVSRIARTLDREVEAFHRRPLGGNYLYLILDGIYLKERTGVGARR